MNDLDKRIAELKGWAVVGAKFNDRYLGIVVRVDGKNQDVSWSTSDAEALELVDELAALPFELLTLSQAPYARWLARFHCPADQGLKGAVGATRPEAICRAYICIREWMEKKS